MKRITIFLIALMMFCSFSTVSVDAHQNASEHYEELEAMLFGSCKFSGSAQDDVQTIERASTLCIDQFGESNSILLTKLKERGVSGIPSNVSEINPDDTDDVRLSPINHRTYTHQGWEHSYTSEEHGDLARWPVRKNILLASIEKVFDFSTFSGKWLFINFGYSDKCDSFSALVYYNHLLGDYLEDVDPETGSVGKFNGAYGNKIPFASNASNPVDMFSEIEKYLAVLFADQAESSRVYNSLMSDIDTLANKARRISGNSEGTITADDYNDMQDCVRKLMDILTRDNNAVHTLLMNESFFTDVFYPEH